MNVNFKELREEVLKIKKAGEIENILTHETCYNRFKETAEESPNLTAINYLGNKMTFSQALSLIDDIARGFYSLGIRENDVVTVSMLPTLYGVATFYALDKIGVTQHLVNCAASKEELKRELSNFDSKIFICNDIFYTEDTATALKQKNVTTIITTSLTDGLPKVLNADKIKYTIIEISKGIRKKDYDNKHLMNFKQLLHIAKTNPVDVPICSYKSNHMAAVAYTSGSTGHSKACVATWEGIDSMVQTQAMSVQDLCSKGDTMFSTIPLWIFYSLINMIHDPLCMGMAVALDPLYDPKNLEKRNKQYQFNHWLTAPTFIEKSVHLTKRKIDCSRWKIIMTGGEPLKNETKRMADSFIQKNGGHVELGQGYGATESLGSLFCWYYKNPSLGSVGKACIGNFVKIIDPETGKEVDTNESGIAYVYSPSLMKEYYNDEESTKNTLIKDENGAIWYNTGDYVWLNERGEMFFDDRVKRLVLTIDDQNNPTKISPARVKSATEKIDIVEKCEIITIPDKRIINKPIAIIKLKSGIARDQKVQEKILAQLNHELPKYMIPKELKFIDEFPLTASSKVDLQKLEQIYLSTSK